MRSSCLVLTIGGKLTRLRVSLYNQGLENVFNNVRIEYFTSRKTSPTLQDLTSIFTVRGLLNKIQWKDFDVHFNYNSFYFQVNNLSIYEIFWD